MGFKLMENKEDRELLTESSLNRIISGHDVNGYVMISASRGDCLNGVIENPSMQQIEDENNKRTTELKNNIRSLHYSYIPVFDGYKEENSDSASIEKSFIVFPYVNINKVQTDFKTFEKDMIELGKKYNQDAILIKRPNENPKYYYTNTDTWDNTDFGNVSLKDAQQQYFTALKKYKDSSLDKKGQNWSKYPQRFSYVESYLDYPPMSIMSASARHNAGELFSMEHYKK